MNNLMFTPAMDRDIGSSYMLGYMPGMAPMGMGPMVGCYPNSIMGERPLRPIPQDKFESLEQKKEETKKSAKKAGGIMAGVAALVAAGILIASRGKIKTKIVNSNLLKNISKNKTFRKAKVVLYKATKSVKNFFAGVIGKFKKAPATPPVTP